MEMLRGQFDGYWTHAIYNFIGKWLIYVKNEELKKYWEIIFNAAMNGDLDPVSQHVKTTNKLDNRPEKVKPIVVYTPDYRDKENVKNIRRKLYNLGIIFPISYKTDNDTRAGKEFRLYYDKGYEKILGGKGILGNEELGESLDFGLKLDLNYFIDLISD